MSDNEVSVYRNSYNCQNSINNGVLNNWNAPVKLTIAASLNADTGDDLGNGYDKNFHFDRSSFLSTMKTLLQAAVQEKIEAFKNPFKY